MWMCSFVVVPNTLSRVRWHLSLKKNKFVETFVLLTYWRLAESRTLHAVTCYYDTGTMNVVTVTVGRIDRMLWTKSRTILPAASRWSSTRRWSTTSTNTTFDCGRTRTTRATRGSRSSGRNASSATSTATTATCATRRNAPVSGQWSKKVFQLQITNYITEI